MQGMDGDSIARLAFLGLLVAAIGGSFLMQNRARMGEVARGAAIWALIFLGTLAAIGLWSDIRDEVAPRQAMVDATTVEVPRGRDGHYYLTLLVNEVPVIFVVDTGATDMVLSQRDARAVGLDPDNLAYLGTAQTANGLVRTASVRLDSVELGDIRDTGLRAVVNEGQIDASLLGMGYLGLFDRIEITGGKLVLTR
jgi:aspartyl protease family protein